MAATPSRVLQRIISPPIYSGLLIGLHGEFESKIKFIIYADVIRYSFEIQSCLVKLEKQAEEKSKYRMKFQKDTNNFLPCIIEHGQILNTGNLVQILLPTATIHPAVKRKGLTNYLLLLTLVSSPSVWGYPTTAVLLTALVTKVLGKILELAWLGSQLFHVEDRLGLVFVVLLDAALMSFLGVLSVLGEGSPDKSQSEFLFPSPRLRASIFLSRRTWGVPNWCWILLVWLGTYKNALHWNTMDFVLQLFSFCSYS